MKIITQSKGRAAEYGKLSLNLYIGCDHGCRYCYGPGVCHLTPDDFRIPKPKKNALARLEKDARDLAGETEPIFLSFITDPYSHIDNSLGLTRMAIQILHANNLRVKILTKGGQRSFRDFDLLGPEDSYGATLTFVDGCDSKYWEPRAASPGERISMLDAAHKKGIPTWVSLEPVIDPKQTLELVRRTHNFVDEYRVGKLNYSPSDVDWTLFAHQLVNLFNAQDCAYFIKQDLYNYCPQGTPQRREKKHKVVTKC